MTEAERLARLVRRLMGAGLAIVAVWVAWTAAAGMGFGRSRVDPRTGTAGLAVEVDAGTGCQYIVTPWGGIVPRTGRDGKVLCGSIP